MEFSNRLKKELTEGIVRSLLVDAGYRVIDFGIESTIREIESMKLEEYLRLSLPRNLRIMPDLVVMDRDQTMSFMVEVKYRNGWKIDLFEEIEEQVKTWGRIYLIYVNGAPPEDKKGLQSPSRNIRCCELTHHESVYCFTGLDGKLIPIDCLRADENQWWGMNLLQNLFPLFHEKNREQTIHHAVSTIRHILT